MKHTRQDVGATTWNCPTHVVHDNTTQPALNDVRPASLITEAGVGAAATAAAVLWCNIFSLGRSAISDAKKSIVRTLPVESRTFELFEGKVEHASRKERPSGIMEVPRQLVMMARHARR